MPRNSILLIGCGDIARRLLPLLVPRHRVFALVRRGNAAAAWRRHGAQVRVGDLDASATLAKLPGLADAVVYLAPPPNRGAGDPRLRRFLAALECGKRNGKSLPQRFVYISTSGVYGNCGGARIDETQPPHPATARGRRRVAAERALLAYASRRRINACILRVPGIYAADRLPRERLLAHTPALREEDDVYSNHIHADDLAAIILAALRHGRRGRVYHASDDSDMKMGDYFDRVADALGLPHPPRVSRGEAERVLSPLQMSFMSESRRLSNMRMKRQLGVRLRYPTVDTLLDRLRNTACSG